MNGICPSYRPVVGENTQQRRETSPIVDLVTTIPMGVIDYISYWLLVKSPTTVRMQYLISFQHHKLEAISLSVPAIVGLLTNNTICLLYQLQLIIADLFSNQFSNQHLSFCAY